MFVNHAQQFTAEQVNAFLVVIGGVLIANIGHIAGWAFRSLRKKIKGEADIKAAHDKIRELTKRVERLEGE
nr:hypothetical protein CKG001_17560 [Bdellovibrio sp. CKG001]